MVTVLTSAPLIKTEGKHARKQTDRRLMDLLRLRNDRRRSYRLRKVVISDGSAGNNNVSTPIKLTTFRVDIPVQIELRRPLNPLYRHLNINVRDLFVTLTVKCPCSVFAKASL